ncbi:MAG: hypothetical protein HYZ28_05640 [Myxococcales bacterium]|nr:hypothetical protein [Myxococcales bacterium]
MGLPLFLACAVAVGQSAPYAYSPANKRDPFQPPAGAIAQPDCKKGSCRYSLDELKLVAIAGGAQRLAMVQGPSGIGYIVRAGDRLARERARVLRVAASFVELELTLADGSRASQFLRLQPERGEAPEDLSAGP